MTLANFVLAMTLFPEKQALAQAEIDQVIGTSRFPKFEDRDALPYVGALIKEIISFYPPLPLGMYDIVLNSLVLSTYPTGLPRCSTEDDIYNGMFISIL